MKLNKRGITLMELIVSIALISIVIMFLFRLLVDVRYSNNNTDFNRENQQNRAIIINNVQKEFIERKLIGIDFSASPGGTDGYLNINFTYKDGTNGTLSFHNDEGGYIMYRNNTLNTKEKWYLKKENDDTKFNLYCVKFSKSDITDSSEYYYIRFSIPVIVNKDKSNTLDDFEFSYIGKKTDLLSTNSFRTSINGGLGNYEEARCS